MATLATAKRSSSERAVEKLSEGPEFLNCNSTLCLLSIYKEQGTPINRTKSVKLGGPWNETQVKIFQPKGMVLETKNQPFHLIPKNLRLGMSKRE